jgi:hypothetical protein
MIKIENTELYKKTNPVLAEYWRSNNDDLKYEFCIHLIQYACGKYYDYKRVNKKKAHSLKALETYRKTNTSSSKAFQFQRLLFGYRIDLTPYKTKLSSKEGNFKESKDVVKDHIIGTSLIGFYVVYEFKNKLRDVLKTEKDVKPFKVLSEIKYDKNWFELICKAAEEFSSNWLQKHLCLWAQCRITNIEHEKDNLVRGWDDDDFNKEKDFQLTDQKKLKILKKRLNLFHYKNAKKPIEIEFYERPRKPKP